MGKKVTKTDKKVIRDWNTGCDFSGVKKDQRKCCLYDDMPIYMAPSDAVLKLQAGGQQQETRLRRMYYDASYDPADDDEDFVDYFDRYKKQQALRVAAYRKQHADEIEEYRRWKAESQKSQQSESQAPTHASMTSSPPTNE